MAHKNASIVVIYVDGRGDEQVVGCDEYSEMFDVLDKWIGPFSRKPEGSSVFIFQTDAETGRLLQPPLAHFQKKQGRFETVHMRVSWFLLIGKKARG